MFRLFLKEKLYWTLLVTFAVTVVYYIVLLATAMIRFQDIPNYVNFYSWLDNVIVIFQSTPSFTDAIGIVSEEWWFEIGFMNYDFGMGISEWSLYLVPFGYLKLFIAIWLFIINLSWLRYQKKNCRIKPSRKVQTTSSIGAALIAASSISLSWVVCCSTPSWIVGLAILGLGVSTSLWLEPLGIYLTGFGFLFLVLALLAPIISNRKTQENLL